MEAEFFRLQPVFLINVPTAFCLYLELEIGSFLRLYNIPNASSSPSVLRPTVGLCGQHISHWHVVYVHGTMQIQIHILSLSALKSKSVGTLNHLACMTDSDFMCYICNTLRYLL